MRHWSVLSCWQLVGLCWFVLSSCAQAQVLPKRSQMDLPVLPSIIDTGALNMEAPASYLDALWEDLETFHATAPTLKGPHFAVVHLGDSHVQAGFFTEPLRRFFFNRFGYGGPGWVAPYRLAGTNEPQHYSIRSERNVHWYRELLTRPNEKTLGPGGLAVWHHLKQPTTLHLKTKGWSDGSFDEVVAYRSRNKSYLVPTIRSGVQYTVKGSGLVKNTNEELWVDSLFLLTPRHSLDLRLGGHTKFYGAQLLLKSGGVLVHTMGLNGATYEHYTENGSAPLIASLSPRLVIVSLGTNDSLARHFEELSFRSKVRELVMALKKEMPDCRIIITSPAVSYNRVRIRRRRYRYSHNKNVGRVAELIREVAKQEEVGFIDLYQAFGGSKKAALLLKNNILRNDRIHFTIEGYELYGKLIVYALMKDYNRFLEQEQHKALPSPPMELAPSMKNETVQHENRQLLRDRSLAAGAGLK